MPGHILKLLVENGAIVAALGGVGGVARIVTGMSPNDSFLTESGRLIFIAMPFGWIAGGLATEWGATAYGINCTAIVIGLASNNIAKAIMEVGVMEVIKMMTGRK